MEFVFSKSAHDTKKKVQHPKEHEVKLQHPTEGESTGVPGNCHLRLQDLGLFLERSKLGLVREAIQRKRKNMYFHSDSVQISPSTFGQIWRT